MLTLCSASRHDLRSLADMIGAGAVPSHLDPPACTRVPERGRRQMTFTVSETADDLHRYRRPMNPPPALMVVG